MRYPAAYITRTARPALLGMAKEMNPQLAKPRVVARSRPMNGSVVARPAEGRPFHKELIDFMLSLHEAARGREMPMVLKSDRLVRLGAGDLEAGHELWRDYYRLPTAPGIRAPAPAGGVAAGPGPERY
jgi:hypothetical protein